MYCCKVQPVEGMNVMNGATLRTYRRLLGYDINDYAEELGINRRTVTRWETGDWPVPDDVALRVRDDLSELRAVADELRDSVPKGADEAEFVRYRRSEDIAAVTKSTTSAEIYNAAAGLAALGLEAQGCIVSLEWASDV